MKKQNKLYINNLAYLICYSQIVGRSNFLLGRSLHGFLLPRKSLHTTTVFRNESLLLNTMSASHNAIYDIIIKSNLSLVEKQLKIEEIVRDY